MYPKNSSRNRVYRQDGSSAHISSKTGSSSKSKNYLSHQPQAPNEAIRGSGNTKLQNPTTERSINFDKRVGSSQAIYPSRIMTQGPQQGQRSFLNSQTSKQYASNANTLSKEGLSQNASQLLTNQSQIQTKPAITKNSNSLSSKLIGSRFEKKSRHLSESNINTLLSPGSNYAVKASAIGQVLNHKQGTPKSHTPLRQELNTQKLHNQLYGVPGYAKSPITTGDKIVIISDKKKSRKSAYEQGGTIYEGQIPQIAQKVKKFGSTLQQQGQRLPKKVVGYIGGHPGGASLRKITTHPANTGSVNRVSTKRIEFNGVNGTIRGSNLEVQDGQKLEISGINKMRAYGINPNEVRGTIPGTKPGKLYPSKNTRISAGRVIDGGRGPKGAIQGGINRAQKRMSDIKTVTTRATKTRQSNRANLQFYDKKYPTRGYQGQGKQREKENLKPKKAADWKYEINQMRISETKGLPRQAPKVDNRDERISELEGQVTELKKIIESINHDKNLALKFNKLLLERLDDLETPESSAMNEED